jgi:putative aldouronate transport system substrate-binding protein
VTTQAASQEETDAPEADTTSEEDSASAEETVASTISPALQIDTEAHPVAGDVEVSLPVTEETKTYTWFMKGSDAIGTIIQSLDENYSVKVFEEKTNVHFDFISPTFDTASEQFNILIASGTYPDVNNGVYNYYTSGLDSAIDEGIITDLTDYAAAVPNYTRFLDAADLVEKAAHTDTGRLWGFASVGFDSPVQWGPMVRQDWLEETGLDTPVTVEDWENLLVAFQENGHSNALLLHENGFACFFGSEGAISSAYNVTPLGNEDTNAFYNVDGTIYYSPMTENYKEYLKLISDWYARDLIYKDFTSASMGNTRDIISQGSIGLFVWNASDMEGLANSIGVESCISPITLPVLDADNPESHFYNFTQPVTSGLCVGGNVSGEDLDVLLSWFNYLYSDEGAVLSTYGEENVTFEYDENGIPQFTEMIYNNPNPSYSTDLAADGWTMKNMGGVGIWQATYDVPNADQKALEASNLWTTYDADYVLPTISLTADESYEASSSKADIETYVSEYTLKCIIGEYDVDATWEEYLSKLDAMGVQEVVSVYQAALDRYMSK